MVPGSNDDVPARGPRGAVPPPRSMEPEDAPNPVDVPRMEPPPPSLEAMMHSRPRSSRRKEETSGSWLLWILLVLVAAGITAYVTR
jgi:hypothetical protein